MNTLPYAHYFWQTIINAKGSLEQTGARKCFTMTSLPEQFPYPQFVWARVNEVSSLIKQKVLPFSLYSCLPLKHTVHYVDLIQQNFSLPTWEFNFHKYLFNYGEMLELCMKCSQLLLTTWKNVFAHKMLEQWSIKCLQTLSSKEDETKLFCNSFLLAFPSLRRSLVMQDERTDRIYFLMKAKQIFHILKMQKNLCSHDN